MRLFIVVFSCLGFVAVPRLIRPPEHSAGVRSAAERFAAESRVFAASSTELRKALERIKQADGGGAAMAGTTGTEAAALIVARQRLAECRLQYKQIESFLEYFFRSSSSIFNRPPKFEPEEPDMEYQSPVGLQVIESLLYEDRIDKNALLEQAKAIENAASDLPSLLYDFKANDQQVLESLRIELVRIIALDITGYEAPLLKSGVRESYAALQAFASQLQPYIREAGLHADSLSYFLEKTMAMLNAGQSFDAFDRLTFLREGALPLQRQLGLFIREKGLELNTGKGLNYSADDLFRRDALIPVGKEGSKERIALGQRFFSDPTLSGNGMKSCASCHNPSKLFTDGLKTSMAFDGHHMLDRNAPSLLYSGYQYDQFWDGRVRSLEEQIRAVLHDRQEMNADTVALKGRGEDSIVTALAAYVRSLHPMNSRFDQYINRTTEVFDMHEKRGANLFMGKAQCATCHFIPLFNGLIPPYYEVTEFEVLGTTGTDQFDTAIQAGKAFPTLTLSPDQGRFTVYPFPFYKGAFKTPTVRNTAGTAPYMHNGAFHNLQSVLEFYNKGGGAGLGLHVPDQTLSPVPLHLSAGEIDDIILFIHTLTDSLNTSLNVGVTFSN